MLQQHVLPAYERLGSLTPVYLLGSLVSGYTQDADLDMMMVWDELDAPAGALRELLVARFEEQPNASPCVVDYRDIHLERVVLAGQEYNVAHLPLASFEAIIRSVLLVALLTPQAVAVLRLAERGVSSAEKPEITAKLTKGWGGLSKHYCRDRTALRLFGDCTGTPRVCHGAFQAQCCLHHCVGIALAR